MHLRALLLVLVLAAGIGAAVALRQPWRADDELETRFARLADEVVAAGLPGTVALLRDGSETWTVAAGVADRQVSEPMHADARFRIGSVTKTMVATVVLQLVRERRIGLDDSVERWLPGLVPKGTAITVRHLLAHTSGLGDYADARFVREAPEWAPRRLAVHAVARPRVFSRPGSKFAYASTNYILLGLIVEAATGTGLAEHLENRIFEPLVLRETSFSPGRVQGRHIHGYRASEHQGIVTGRLADVTDDSAAGAWAAGAVVSTTKDLARFFSALLRGELLRGPELRAMRTPQVRPRRYGLGLMVFETPCGPVYGHTGNINGQLTAAWNTVDASRQLVVAANAYPLSPEADSTLYRTLETAFCFL